MPPYAHTNLAPGRWENPAILTGGLLGTDSLSHGAGVTDRGQPLQSDRTSVTLPSRLGPLGQPILVASPIFPVGVTPGPQISTMRIARSSDSADSDSRSQRPDGSLRSELAPRTERQP